MLTTSTPRPKTLDDLLTPALLARLDRLDVMSRKVFAGKLPGERRSKRRGQSVEFDDYREYVHGDDLRHIDWNVFARMDKFFLKLFREEEDLALHIAVDASLSMDAGDKIILAQRLAIALGYIGLVNNNRVVMSVFGLDGLHMLSPIRGRRNVTRMTRFVLDRCQPPASGVPTPPSFTDAMRTLALSRSGRGVLVILSDFLYTEDLRTAFNYLVGSREPFDTYCAQILSPGELDPATERDAGLVGDLRLTDVETGRTAEVTISAALIKKYRERLEAHLDALRTACAARNMNHILLRADADVETLLLDVLRRRGLLG